MQGKLSDSFDRPDIYPISQVNKIRCVCEGYERTSNGKEVSMLRRTDRGSQRRQAALLRVWPNTSVVGALLC
jgi:hypothetical protein